jgi:ferredoxin-NADP reductase
VPRIRYGGCDYDLLPAESVLEALLRQGVELAYSCRKGSCLTCLLRCSKGRIPSEAENGLRESLRAQGYFLACLASPEDDVELVAPADADLFGRARMIEIERLAPTTTRIRLESATPLYYHPGQFINIRRGDGLMRSYSLASVPRLEAYLEIHVKRLDGGAMSGWLNDEARVGDTVDIQGANGSGFYLPGRPDQPLLLIGNGSGLAPLYGIARDALADGHRGEIRLYHGSRTVGGLYLRDALRALAARHDNFSYLPCISGPEPGRGDRVGRAEIVAFGDLPQLSGWRVFLCGYPPMVDAARRAAYLAGARLADIHADAFELRDLRKTPRG